MKADFFKGKRVTVFGIGLLGGGVGTIRFLVEQGARVIATDIKTKEELAPTLERLADLKNVEYVLGQHRREDFTKVDMVIKTPQALWTNKHIKLALDQKIPVEVDASLFFKLCKNPIIGVTGTKGKSTTSHMIAQILKHAGKHVVTVGVGQTPVLDRLRLLKKNSVVVFELSNWRLSSLMRDKMSPHIAVFTNLMPDHLNYYRTMEEYFNDKKQIFVHQKSKDWFIANDDDERLQAAMEAVPGQVSAFSMQRPLQQQGVYAAAGQLFLCDGEERKPFMTQESIHLRGVHNIANALAAAAAARAAGIKPADIAAALGAFKGLPHRLEQVQVVDEVRYVNDSAATIPAAAMAGLASFEAPVVLIAGGTDKGLDYAAFAEAIHERAKAVVFIKGKATDKIIAALHALAGDEKPRSFEIADSMEKAVDIAARGAEPGDVVLLSPGAASFGVFRNEFERGELFRKAVMELSE